MKCILLVLLLAGCDFTTKDYDCSKACLEKGWPSYTRILFGNACYCKNKDKSKRIW